MNEKDKVVAELSGEKWLWDLALLCDVSHHLNDLNTKFQCQRNISDVVGALRAFEMKRKLFRKELICVIFLVICFIRMD
jgi:hypothetical protein